MQGLLSELEDSPSEQQVVGRAFELLQHQQQVPLADVPATGVPPEIEQRLSPIFLQPFKFNGRHYGTRSQTVVLVWRLGEAVMQEHLREVDGSIAQRSRQEFRIEV